MIKALLLILLLTFPVQAKDHHLTPRQCRELAQILDESVKAGHINKHEAKIIYNHCIK
jgi:hypothetical protein